LLYFLQSSLLRRRRRLLLILGSPKPSNHLNTLHSLRALASKNFSSSSSSYLHVNLLQDELEFSAVFSLADAAVTGLVNKPSSSSSYSNPATGAPRQAVAEPCLPRTCTACLSSSSSSSSSSPPPPPPHLLHHHLLLLPRAASPCVYKRSCPCGLDMRQLAFLSGVMLSNELMLSNESPVVSPSSSNSLPMLPTLTSETLRRCFEARVLPATVKSPP